MPVALLPLSPRRGAETAGHVSRALLFACREASRTKPVGNWMDSRIVESIEAGGD
jgi:hypothetical protein